MANCNCNDFPISCAPHAPGGDCCHHPHGCPPHPCPPPDYKGGTSMYIGARYVPIFADPVEWDDEREYEPLTIVIKDGDCYTSKCYVPKGAQLPPYPENQTKYWVKTSDYNYQFADLKKTVTDLSRLVEQFQKDNEKFTELINGWNATVTEWTAKMTEWQGQMDNFEQSLNDLTAKLNEEIQRAKDAEQANAAAIAKETADREKAVSELDAAYKAADASIREDFTAADAAEKAAREAADAQLTADIAAEKTRAEGQETAIREEFAAADAAEKAAREAADAQLTADIAAEKTRAEGQETAIREEFAAADTALSSRITSNKTDIDAIKAEQVIQNTNISNNAKNITDNAAEIAKHADRLTALESNASDWATVFPDTTIAQEVQKEELARANADTALNGRCDAIAADVEEVRDLANHKVDTTTYTEGQAAQDAKIKANSDNIGAWSTDHPNQTISECVTSIENTVEGLDAELDTKANKTDLKDWVLTDTYTAGQAAQDKRIEALEDKPDVDLSGYVQTTTYTAGQAAQDKRIKALEDKPDVDLSGYVQTTTYTAGQAAQDTKINEAKTAADKANAIVSTFSVPVNLDLAHGAIPTAINSESGDDVFTLTFQIANPAFSSDRSKYTLNANNIDNASIGYRVWMITASLAGGTPTIVTSTLAETPTLQMSADATVVIGTLKVNGTRPGNSIIAVYWAGHIAGQITYEAR